MTDTPVRVDWPRLILDLRRAGWSNQRIGAAIGVSQSAVNTYVNLGCEPAYSTGCLLVALHRAHATQSDRQDSAQPADG